MIRLLSRLHVVGGGVYAFGISHELDCHIYLLDGGSEMALLDVGTGLRTEDVLENVRRAGLDPRGIRRAILTHSHLDHAGGAASVRDALGCEIIAPNGAADGIRAADPEGTGYVAGVKAGFFPSGFLLRPCPIDREVGEGDIVTVGDLRLEAMKTPGHSAWDVSYKVAIDGVNCLFGGDLVFAGGRILVQATPGCDEDIYRQSILRIEETAPDALLPGHMSISLRFGAWHIAEAARACREGRLPPNLFDPGSYRNELSKSGSDEGMFSASQLKGGAG